MRNWVYIYVNKFYHFGYGCCMYKSYDDYLMIFLVICHDQIQALVVALLYAHFYLVLYSLPVKVNLPVGCFMLPISYHDMIYI